MRNQDWDDYERAANKGPVSLGVKAIVGGFALIALITILTLAAGSAFNACSDTALVAQEQFGARALLKKYEYFKDAAAQAGALRATVETMRARQTALEKRYAGKDPSSWSRSDAEQYNVWITEAAGTIAAYNNLAAEYNAQMAKFNWRFANRGDLPAGADVPLPGNLDRISP